MTWNNRPGSGARHVIDAMFAGKPAKKGNFHTDGVNYFVYGCAIAKRVEVPVPERVIHKLMTGEEPVRLAYRIPSGLDRRVAANHLDMFPGIWAYDYGVPHIVNKTVKHDTWYRLDELDALPDDYVEPLPEVVSPQTELFPA
jgi:hypothetical protein